MKKIWILPLMVLMMIFSLYFVNAVPQTGIIVDNCVVNDTSAVCGDDVAITCRVRDTRPASLGIATAEYYMFDNWKTAYLTSGNVTYGNWTATLTIQLDYYSSSTRWYKVRAWPKSTSGLSASLTSDEYYDKKCDNELNLVSNPYKDNQGCVVDINSAVTISNVCTCSQFLNTSSCQADVSGGIISTVRQGAYADCASSVSNKACDFCDPQWVPQYSACSDTVTLGYMTLSWISKNTQCCEDTSSHIVQGINHAGSDCEPPQATETAISCLEGSYKGYMLDDSSGYLGCPGCHVAYQQENLLYVSSNVTVILPDKIKSGKYQPLINDFDSDGYDEVVFVNSVNDLVEYEFSLGNFTLQSNYSLVNASGQWGYLSTVMDRLYVPVSGDRISIFSLGNANISLISNVTLAGLGKSGLNCYDAFSSCHILSKNVTADGTDYFGNEIYYDGTVYQRLLLGHAGIKRGANVEYFNIPVYSNFFVNSSTYSDVVWIVAENNTWENTVNYVPAVSFHNLENPYSVYNLPIDYAGTPGIAAVPSVPVAKGYSQQGYGYVYLTVENNTKSLNYEAGKSLLELVRITLYSPAYQFSYVAGSAGTATPVWQSSEELGGVGGSETFRGGVVCLSSTKCYSATNQNRIVEWNGLSWINTTFMCTDCNLISVDYPFVLGLTFNPVATFFKFDGMSLINFTGFTPGNARGIDCDAGTCYAVSATNDLYKSYDWNSEMELVPGSHMGGSAVIRYTKGILVAIVDNVGGYGYYYFNESWQGWQGLGGFVSDPVVVDGMIAANGKQSCFSFYTGLSTNIYCTVDGKSIASYATLPTPNHIVLSQMTSDGKIYFVSSINGGITSYFTIDDFPSNGTLLTNSTAFPVLDSGYYISTGFARNLFFDMNGKYGIYNYGDTYTDTDRYIPYIYGVTTSWTQFQNNPSNSMLADDYTQFNESPVMEPTTFDLQNIMYQPIVFNIDNSTDYAKELILADASALKVYTMGGGLTATYSKVQKSEGVVCDYDRDDTFEYAAVFLVSGVHKLNILSFPGGGSATEERSVELTSSADSGLAFGNVLCMNLDADADYELATKDSDGNLYWFDMTDGQLSSYSNAASSLYEGHQPDAISNELVYLSSYTNKKALAFIHLYDLGLTDSIKMYVRTYDNVWTDKTVSWDTSDTVQLHTFTSDITRSDIVSDGLSRVYVSVATEYADYDPSLTYLTGYSYSPSWPYGKIMGWDSGTEIFDKTLLPSAVNVGGIILKATPVPFIYYYKSAPSCSGGCLGYLRGLLSVDLGRDYYKWYSELFQYNDDATVIKSSLISKPGGQFCDAKGTPLVGDFIGSSAKEVLFSYWCDGSSDNEFYSANATYIIEPQGGNFSAYGWAAPHGIVSPVVVDANNDNVLDIILASPNSKLRILASTGTFTYSAQVPEPMMQYVMLYRGLFDGKVSNPVKTVYAGQEVVAVANTNIASGKSAVRMYTTVDDWAMVGEKQLPQQVTNQYLTAADFNDDNYPEYMLGYGVYDFQANPYLKKLLGFGADYRILPVNINADDYLDLFYSGAGGMGVLLSVPPIAMVQAASNTSISNVVCSVSGRSISVMASTTYKIGTDPNLARFRIKYGVGTASNEVSGIKSLPYVLPSQVTAGTYTVIVYYKDSNSTEVSSSCTAEIKADSISEKDCFYLDGFDYSNDIRDHGWLVVDGTDVLRPMKGILVMNNDRRTSSDFSLSFSRDVACPYVDLYYEFGFNATANVDFEVGLTDNYGEDVGMFGVSGGKFRMYGGNGSTRKVVGTYVPASGRFYNIKLKFEGVTKKVVAYYCVNCEKNLAGDYVYNETIGESDWVNAYDLANYKNVVPYTTAYVTVYDGVLMLDRIAISSSGGAVMWSGALEVTKEQGYLQTCNVMAYCLEFSESAKKSLTSGKIADIYCTMQELGSFMRKVPRSGEFLVNYMNEQNVLENDTTEGGCYKQALDYCVRYSYPFSLGNGVISGEIDSDGISVCGMILTASVGTTSIAVPIWNVGSTLVRTYPLQIAFLIIIAIVVIAIYVRSKS
jgi:hypothetical protein